MEEVEELSPGMIYRKKQMRKKIKYTRIYVTNMKVPPLPPSIFLNAFKFNYLLMMEELPLPPLVPPSGEKLPTIKSTVSLFEGELGESDQQRKGRLIYEWICNRIKKGKPPTWSALITSEILDGGAGMYEYPMKTLVEGGLVNEIKKTLKRTGYMFLLINKLGKLEKVGKIFQLKNRLYNITKIILLYIFI